MAEISLEQAASTGNLEGVQQALRHQAPEINPSTLLEALNKAVFNGHSEIVKVLLANGAPINGRARNGNTPLTCAVENLNAELVKYLLDNCADVNTQDESGITPLHQAIDCEAEYAKSLYDGGDVDASPTIQISNVLIDAGANVNAKNNRGETPLRWALDQWHKPAEDLLLRNGGHL